MIRPEILAPAGGMEQLEAAVRSGADAVYLGTDGFNARQNAKNFSDDDLKNAVKYCHQRGVRVHVTLNTLVFDDEIEKLIQKIKIVAECGVDAVIVQDIAVARLVRECCPDLPMHASTQLTVHNTAGALMMKELGFSRVVLAREMTLEEISSVTENAGIETEVFVHGALCTCVSGACYLSGMLGGRSGNRGYCAQPCRLNFVNPHGREYALSLKDMSHVEYARKLRDVGVISFKIEGRMKRPEYVAASVTAVRAALEGKSPDMSLLEKVFSRSGFTNGYITGKRTVEMYGYRTKDDVMASAEALGQAASLYRAERQSVPVDMEIVVKQGRDVELTVTDGINYVTATSSPPQIAQNKVIDEEYIRRSLTKTGGTPFYCDALNTHISGDVMVPASELNNLRRKGLEELMEQRGYIIPYGFKEPLSAELPKHRSGKIKIRLRFENISQMAACDNADEIVLPLDEILQNKKLTEKYKSKLIAEIPHIMWENEANKLASKLEALNDMGIKDVLCNNIGAVYAAINSGCTVHGGYGLNIINSLALTEYEKLGLADAELSFEIGMNRIRGLNGDIQRGIIAYGYLPLMSLRMCPGKGKNGCGDCNGKPVLTDRTGVKFQLLCRNKQYTELLNSVPLYIGDRSTANTDFATLYFTGEDKNTVLKVVNSFVKGEKLEEKHTSGLYFRDVL